MTSLELEMELWKERANNAFGKKLAEIADHTSGFFVEEDEGYGIKCTPISKLKTIYSVDGDAKSIYLRCISILTNYDIICDEDVELNIMLNELKRIAYDN